MVGEVSFAGGGGAATGETADVGGRPARATGVARRLSHLDRVSDVAGEGRVGLTGGAGEGQATAAKTVALQPLVGEAGRFVRPCAVSLGERLALLGGSGDRGQGFIR